MSIFDLLFLTVALVTLLTLLATAWLAVRGQFRRAAGLMTVLLAGAAIYMGAVVLVSLILPRRVLNTGDEECFDDWCIGVARWQRRAAADSGVGYEVDLRLRSRARRVFQREKNLSVYLTDKRRRRYNPAPKEQAEPIDVLLGPGQSVFVRRECRIPAVATDVGLVAAHEGGFPIGWFVIGYDTWFRPPGVIRLGDGSPLSPAASSGS